MEPAIAAAVKAKVADIQRMAPVLLAGDRLGVTLGDGGPVSAGAWKYQQAIYVKAVNALEYPVTTGFAVEGCWDPAFCNRSTVPPAVCR